MGETNTWVQTRFPDGSKPEWRPAVTPRQALAEWITRPDNPWFARAAVNRLWQYFFGAGLIDTIVSDHNPQDVETKRLPFAEAANGAIGLETMLAAALRLVHAGAISLPKLLAAMTVRPAEILRLPHGRLAKSAPADLIRFDPDEPFIVNPAKLHSRCRNTPFDEARLQGVVKMTMVAGEIVYE